MFTRFGVLRLGLGAYKSAFDRFRNDQVVKALVEDRLKEAFGNARIEYVNHHEAHLWATVPFMSDRRSRYLLVSLDGEGDDLSGMIGVLEDGRIEVKHRFRSSESLGLLYSSVVDVLGMARNEHEFKVMGLAPYAKASAGEKAFEQLKQMLWFDAEKMEFDAATDMRTATDYLVAHNTNTAFRFDSLAYGIQKLTEVITQNMVREAVRRYKAARVAVGGGVFMNVKANQHIAAMPEVEELLVTPSCGDESLAIGAAVKGYALLHDHDLSGLQQIKNLYLGSEYTDEEIASAIKAYPAASSWTLRHFDPRGGADLHQDRRRGRRDASIERI